VFITGDMKFHQAQAVMQQGLVMDVGHFSLEENMMRTWSRELENILAPTQIRVVFLPGVDPFF
jgi:putative NIF3 family GTP cyclohydrolase 1 type 2